MARTFVAASSQYLHYDSSAPTSTVPLTVAVWIKPVAQAAGVRYLYTQENGTAGATEMSLVVAADGTVYAIHYDGPHFGQATTTAKVTAGAWNHACAVFAGTASRSVYLNGANKVTETTSVANAMNCDHVTVGAYTAGPAFFFNGDLGEVAVWNVALSDADVALLATGALPSTVQPGSLVFYAPVGGVYSPETDQMGVRNLTVSGATASTSFPPLTWPNGFSGQVRFPSPILPPTRARSFTQSIDLARFFPPVPPGISSYGWAWPKPVFPKSSHATLGGFVHQTDLYAVPDFSSALIYITVNGIARAYGRDTANGSIDSGSLSIQDVLDETPNTCQFTCRGFTPTVGMRVVMALGGIDNPSRLFSGSILTVNPVYVGTPQNQSFHVSCIDDTWLLNKVKVITTYTATSASAIAEDLLRTYAPGLTWRHVDPSLPTIDVITFTNTDLTACLTQLAKRIGAYWRIDYFGDLWFALTESDGAQPVALTPANAIAIGLSDFASTVTIGDIITRCLVEGGGVNAFSAVAPNDTILPVDLIAINGVVPWFNVLGGRVVCGTQRITYTGVQAGGAGSLVGPGTGPSSAPTLALAAGAGVESGAHTYAVVDRTTNDTTLSLPSPLASITTGAIPLPIVAPTLGVPSVGAGPNTGDHGYAVSFVNATGETTIGPIAHVTTTELSAPSSAPTWPSTSRFGTAFDLYAGNNYIEYQVTFANAAGETTPGPRLQFVFVAGGAGFNSTRDFLINDVPVGPSGTVTRRIYRNSSPNQTGFGNTLYFSEAINDNSTTSLWNTAGANTGLPAPSTNTAVSHVVALSAIPLGDPSVTARNIYRTVAGGSVYKLAHQIADNVTTTWSDTVTDASLGATAPVSNTATANQVSLSAIPLGASGGIVAQRWLYRTVAGGSQLKKLAVLADNTTTVYVDSISDASLGANAPSSDTSGLTQPNGQVLAGQITLLSAGIGWASSTGGWAVIGNGQQVIRYTGYTGNTLTGIPASGIGAIVATIAFNSTITAAPCLTGIPATGTGSILYAINKGDPVNLLVQVDDLNAQAQLSALLDPLNLLGGAAGIREDYLQDGRISETEARARGTAQLALMSQAQTSVTYTCRDPLTASGRTITINLPSPQNINTSLKIQQVTISNFRAAATFFPDYAVQASNIRFSFEDLLRQARGLL